MNDAVKRFEQTGFHGELAGVHVPALLQLRHALVHDVHDRLLDLSDPVAQRLAQLDHLGGVRVKARLDRQLEPRPEVQLPGHEILHHLVNLAEPATQLPGSVRQRAEEPGAIAGAEETDHEGFLGHVGHPVSVCDDDALYVGRGQGFSEDVHRRDAGGDEHRSAVAVYLVASRAGDLRGDNRREGHAV